MSLRVCSTSSRGLSAISSRSRVPHELDRYRIIRRFFIGQPQHVFSAPTSSSSRLESLQNNLFLQSRVRQFHSTSVSSLKGKGKRREGPVDHEERVGVEPNTDVREPETSSHSNNDTPEKENLESQTKTTHSEPVDSEPQQTQTQTEPSPPHRPYILPYNFAHYSKSFRRLALSVPHFHAPTRDDFLRVADGFWQRLRIRFKWFTIKSFRKFNADDISGFITVILMSQTVWILVGTTTFFSVVFAIANSLQLTNSIARAISDYLTAETGVTVIFESAIVPKWKDSRISFKNVYVSRRPQSMSSSFSSRNRKFKEREYQAGLGYDVSNHPAYHRVGDDHDEVEDVGEGGEDCNYTMFDLDIGSVDVTLSLWRWLDGKGLIESAVVKGVRGVLDRRYVQYDPNHPLDPSSFRHPSQPGDFELESLQLEDVLLTVLQPGGFRPHTASIFRADLPGGFRKRWLFYDFLSAENIVGQFDNCLFSLHKPQSIGRTTEMDLRDGEWARMSRLRIDGVNIDHIQAATEGDGPVAWITSGKLDAVFDIKFPQDPDTEHDIQDILEDIADAISTTVLSNTPDPVRQRIPGQRELAKPPLSAPEEEAGGGGGGGKVVVDIDLRFRDVKAAVPIWTNEISYVNNALARPIVAFMKVVKPLGDFDGAWTMWETGLTDEISLKIYDALAHHVTQANFNRRIKTVSVWSLQKTANAVLSALRNLADPMAGRLRETYLRAREVASAEDSEGVFVFDQTVPV
ncbi:Mitochondrial distribution and morphology protein 31, mitochondrial precursor [Marasmius tenuissimus]|uniref:Mitochondrial distribution and morphology protein 31, mitochondrial n=1 Tax=Marasmius tenuissimus TaxID=585030 RepID=A0ABR3A2S9_9AGAR